MRTEVIGDATLYLADCLEVLPTLGRVDAVVTDPPYGIAHKAHSNTPRNGWKGKKAYADATIHGDAKDFDPTPWLKHPCILWGANHYAQSLPRGRWLVWNKLGHLEPWDSFSDVEIAWMNERGSDRLFSLLWKGLAQGEKTGGGERFHPTMKPVALMRWCLGFVPEAQVILDPYMGSGTTGVAALQLGRKFIGIELDPGYFDIACKRISEAWAQPRLFEEPKRKPEPAPSLFGGQP
jgi:site-specific DNA-methyltransferase (adenine-specific)/modification methylase